MSITRFLAPTALAGGLLLAAVAGPAVAGAATPTGPRLPQPASATAGAAWLAGQFTAGGFIPQSGDASQPDLSGTANAVLALAATGTEPTTTAAGIAELEANVDAYVDADGSDDPGALGLLILDAEATGTDPTDFGGTDLVARLLATQQTIGPDAGLFGSQDPTYDGAYRQGTALAALAAAGVTSGSQVTSADQWLQAQQCPDGGWTSYVTAFNPCDGDPADFAGPDTNSTALAVEGLVAQGALTGKPATHALRWITAAQDVDGGWGYEPNAADAPGSSDPDSTALVVQAVLALGKKPQAAAFTKSGADPVSALESFQLTSGDGAGAFFYPGSPDANLLATYQAVPAVAGVRFPFSLRITSGGLATATVGQAYSASLAATGGTAPYTYKVVAGTGSLPKGLRLDRSTGTLAGKPKTAGTSTFTVEVLDTRASVKPKTQGVAFANETLVVEPAT